MIHPVFHISQLELYKKDGLPGCVQPPPKEIVVDGISEWEVREIMDAKIDQQRRVSLMFLIKWFSFEGLPNEIQWLPVDFVAHSKDAVQDFYKLHPNKLSSYKEYLTYLPNRTQTQTQTQISFPPHICQPYSSPSHSRSRSPFSLSWSFSVLLNLNQQTNIHGLSYM